MTLAVPDATGFVALAQRAVMSSMRGRIQPPPGRTASAASETENGIPAHARSGEIEDSASGEQVPAESSQTSPSSLTGRSPWIEQPGVKGGANPARVVAG